MSSQEGRVGAGIGVGSLFGAAGLDVDVAVILGGAEGVLPPTPHPDPLLNDTHRRSIGLPTADDQINALRQQFVTVLSGCHGVVTIPRGDLRATVSNQPSRWLLPYLDRGPEPTRVTIASSHVAALAGVAFPSSEAEHRLASLLHHVGGGDTIDSIADRDPVLERALTMRRAREAATITAYDGGLGGLDIPTLDGQTVSPTAIESWVACPYAYFVQQLLGVRAVEEPDRIIRIEPTERGSLIHDVLDAFHREVIEGHLAQPTSHGWTEDHRNALLALFEATCDRTERRGRSGRPATWDTERRRLRTELLRWLDADSQVAVGRGSSVVASEHRFGVDAPPVTLPLGDGRRLSLRGSFDRVDRTATGGLVVTDHKTGKPDAYRKLTPADPTLGGTVFQLPSYAAAARSVVGPDDAAVVAEYSMFGRGDYQRFGFTITPDIERLVASQLTDVVDGIESGWFPARPERPGFRLWVSCPYCEPDGLGTTDQWERWQRKRHDPRVARWLA
jgi:RecB family exonuclease